MRKYLFLTLTFMMTLSIIFSIVIYRKGFTQTGEPSAPRLIAHAGGSIYGIRLTNSLQALDSSYRKEFRLIELDACWTSDDKLVFIHDWGNANWFNNIKYSAEPLTLDEFHRQKGILNLTFLDLEKLEKWLLKHRDAFIVTDIKSENIKALTLISEKYGTIKNQIIPQVYSFDEYHRASELGYKYIILTLYLMMDEDDKIVEFCRNNELFAITMNTARGMTELPSRLAELGVVIYAHTVNSYNEYMKLRDNGIYGVYTDYFEPVNWVEK